MTSPSGEGSASPSLCLSSISIAPTSSSEAALDRGGAAALLRAAWAIRIWRSSRPGRDCACTALRCAGVSGGDTASADGLRSACPLVALGLGAAAAASSSAELGSTARELPSGPRMLPNPMGRSTVSDVGRPLIRID